jgi:hypothetical protein
VSVEAISAVFERSKAKARGHELLMLIALADCANPKDGNIAYPSLTKLAEKVRLQKSRVCKILNALEAAGELIREKSSGGRNKRSRYILTCLNSVTGNSVTGETVFPKQCHRCNETVSPVRHALNRNRTVKKNMSVKSKSSRPKDSDPRVKEFIGWFFTGYQNRFNEPYHVKGGKDGHLVKDLLRIFDLPELKARALRLWQSEDPFIAKTDRGIGILSSQINALSGATVQPAQPHVNEAPRGDLRYPEAAHG